MRRCAAARPAPPRAPPRLRLPHAWRARRARRRGSESSGPTTSTARSSRAPTAAASVAAAALGNHEFDWGQDTLRARMRDARYPFLGANVRYKDGRDVPWIRDDTLIVRGQLKVGVIGLASVITARTTAVKNIADLQFVAPGPIVDSLSRRLRARGADYVIVLAHDGAFCDRAGTATCRGEIIEIARSIREPVDAIVSGHTHSLVNADVNGIPVVQAYSSGSAIDVIDLGPDTTTHEVRNVIADSLPPDPVVATLVRDAISRVAPIVN